MRLGATLAHLSPAPPYALAPWAKRLVDAGFESLWIHQVVGRGYLVPDPFVALAVAAAVTEGVELGTATAQIPLHHPAEFAHRVLSLQTVCGDRLTLGVSPGSTEVDFTTLGRDHAARFRTFRENLVRVRELITHGRDEHADLGPAPARVPPFLLGSWGKNVERAAREFDGWLASGYRTTPDQIVEALGRYRAAGGGRAMVCAIPVAGPADLGPLGETLHRYADAGFDDAIVVIEPGGPEPEQVTALLP